MDEKNKVPIIEIRTINVYDKFELKGYADGVIVVGEQYHDFLYRIEDDPLNGPGDTIVSIECSILNPLVDIYRGKIKQVIRDAVHERKKDL